MRLSVRSSSVECSRRHKSVFQVHYTSGQWSHWCKHTPCAFDAGLISYRMFGITILQVSNIIYPTFLNRNSDFEDCKAYFYYLYFGHDSLKLQLLVRFVCRFRLMLSDEQEPAGRVCLVSIYKYLTFTCIVKMT